MRYPVTLIPGLPVAPDLSIGLQLTPLAPAPAPVPAAATGGGDASPGAVWSSVVTVSPANTDPLAIVAQYGSDWFSVAGNQLFHIPAGASDEAMAIALVQNLAGGEVITWSLDSVTLSGPLTDTIIGNVLAVYQTVYGTTVMQGTPDGAAYFITLADANLFTGCTIDVQLTPSVDGTPLNALSLSLTSV